jgi:hypothetical protein
MSLPSLEIAIRSAAKNPLFTDKGNFSGLFPGKIRPRKRLSLGIDCAKPAFTIKENTVEMKIDLNAVPIRRLLIFFIP